MDVEQMEQTDWQRFYNEKMAAGRLLVVVLAL